VEATVAQVESLRPGSDHDEAREHLLRQGWVECGRGDWAIALRSPDGRLAARISPFDPAAPFTAALYRAGQASGWFPRLHLELPLDGGGSLLLMELLEPVDIATGAAVHRRLRDPDPEIAPAAALVERFHRAAVAELPWCGPVDDNPANVMRAADGSLRITDPYSADGPTLYGLLLTDPAVVAEAIPRHLRRHLLEIPLAGSGGWDEVQREHMREGLARADGPDPSGVAERFAADLAGWGQDHAEQAGLAREYRDLIARAGVAAVDRDRARQHLTASAFVLSPDLTQVLLCFHRKGGFWVQLGGHVESSDESVGAAALREAREESGITDLRPIARLPLDLDRHALGAGFVRCDVHWDVGFGFTADASAVPIASDESLAVRWWPVAAPPETVPPRFALRLSRAVRAAGAAGA
jgi:8-oxo-dGTP pyrophosphatase MutT (NUDIX family)